MVVSQILLDGAEPRDAERPCSLLQSAGGEGGGEANRILLASALSSMHAMYRVRRRDWIIAVRLGCLVSLRITVPDKSVPFDAKQHMQKSLVEHSCSIQLSSCYTVLHRR